MASSTICSVAVCSTESSADCLGSDDNVCSADCKGSDECSGSDICMGFASDDDDVAPTSAAAAASRTRTGMVISTCMNLSAAA